MFIKLVSIILTSFILVYPSHSYQEWWDIQHFEIELKPDYNRKFISGTNTIQFKVLHPVVSNKTEKNMITPLHMLLLAILP